MISYCIACYRPVYARLLIDELIGKTTAPFEILLWLNVADPHFEAFLNQRANAGAPLRVLGRTPENIGMAAYPRLFAASRFDLIAQIDDDVAAITPGIAETARAAFDRHPPAGMLTADVWQDEYTTGARPPLERYRPVDEDLGLFDGPIDGWFAVYRRASLERCQPIHAGRYYCLGAATRGKLQALGEQGYLCTRMKVFHVVGPAYCAYFGTLESEISKYRALGRHDIVKWYEDARHSLPSADDLGPRVAHIRACLSGLPRG
jgi:hypothetical protein